MPEWTWKLNEKGMALVLALLTISFLVAMTTGLSVDVDAQLDDAASIKRNLNLDNGLASGLNIALALLEGDQLENDYDSTHDAWSRFSTEDTQDILDGVQIKIEITDLSGLLSVNSLLLSASEGGEAREANQQQQQNLENEIYQVWLRLLLSGRFAVEGEQDAREILDCILDWLDEDDQERPYGAENAYYQSLPAPYEAKNGFLDEVAELLAVKGVSSELLFGDDEHLSLAAFLTTLRGDGRININTAPVEILEAMSPRLSPGMAEDMVAFREEEMNSERLQSVGWYKDVVPGDVVINDAIVSVSSLGFNIKVVSAVFEAQKKGEGIFFRGTAQENKLIRWNIE